MLLLLLRGPTVTSTPIVYPISIMGGIIGRFRATAALAALVPGDIHPGIPAGVTRIPWVNIHEIGDPHYEYVAGDPGYMVETARFQLDIAAPSLPQCWAIWLQLLATFSPAQVAADPIPLRSGRIFSTYLDGATTQPSPMPIKASPDANGRRVTRAYRVMGQMAAKATRPLAVTS